MMHIALFHIDLSKDAVVDLVVWFGDLPSFGSLSSLLLLLLPSRLCFDA